MIVKTCGCCGRTFTPAQWAALPSLGTMPSETESGEPCAIELKNCSCDSTLAVEVAES